MADASGGVLPGVTVTITSPRMQGARTAVTNEEGAYRFPASRRANTRFTYELAGFGDGRPRRHQRRRRVHRDDQRPAEGRVAAGDGHRQRRNRRSSTSQTTKTSTNFDAQQLAVAAQRARLLVDHGGRARHPAAAHRRRRQRAPARRPAIPPTTPSPTSIGRWSRASSTPKAPTPPASTTTTARSRKCRSAPARTSAEMPWPGVMSHSSRSPAATRTTAGSTRDYENENIQSRNIDAAQIALGVKGSGGLAGHRSQPDAQLPRPQRRCRRLPEEGQALVVRLAARSAHSVRCCRTSRSSRSRPR